MLEADPVACRPGAQLLVDAFPGHADHLADLLLGNSDGSASLRELVFLGQTKKCAGEPARQIRFKIALRPSGEETLIFTVPLITAMRLLPGSPLETIVAPRFSDECLA